MPQSKNRKAHAHKQHIDYIPHQKKRKSAVPVAIGFCALLALGIAWFANGTIIGLVIGAAVGGVIGYFAGKEMDKTFDKK